MANWPVFMSVVTRGVGRVVDSSVTLSWRVEGCYYQPPHLQSWHIILRTKPKLYGRD